MAAAADPDGAVPLRPDRALQPLCRRRSELHLLLQREEGALRSISYDDNIGYALQAGIDYAIAGAWSFNIDVKKLWLSTDVKVNGGALKADVDLNPWIFGVGLGYRF